MDNGDDTLDGTDEDLGRLLVNRGLITPMQFEAAVKEYKERKGTPRERRLDEVLVEAGFVKDEGFLDNLRIQTRAYARCSKCGKLFQIMYYNPTSAYTCKKCGSKLEQTQVTEATIVVGGQMEKTMLASTQDVTKPPTTVQVPPEVEAAQKDPRRVFGKFVIVKELGRGGTAIVYKAWEAFLCQFIALKIIKADDLDDTGSSAPSNQIEDFQHEARLSAKLRHPNIIRIFELGSINNKHYLSMDLLEGPTLFELIHSGRQRNNETRFHAEPEKFLKIFREVARAVHYAHSQAPPIIHRDLKPQNVLHDLSGNPYVADFGLAKNLEMDHTQTATGVVKGTPSYMAPEQAEGHSREADQRTDVYALGAILYEMLTGRPPFVGDNVRQVLNQIVTKLPERPNEVLAKTAQEKPDKQNAPKLVARQLETICLKCLEKKKVDRYQSANDLADDIDRFLQNLEIEAREPSIIKKVIRKMRTYPILSGTAGALLLTATVATAAVYFSSTEQKGNMDKLVAFASDHLKAEDWSALRTDVDNLLKIDPDDSRIAPYELALKEHDADLELKRTSWENTVQRLKAESLQAVLPDLRQRYQQAAELRSELWDKFERALKDIQGACLKETRELAGAGPNPNWLQETVKQAAQRCHARIVDLLSLTSDREFTFEADPALAGSRDTLDQIVAYQGTWQLRVNVNPFAEVVLLRDGKKVVHEFTPLGLHELEVASGYQLELCWPSQADPRRKTSRDLNGLRHGALVVVTGDVAKPEIRVTP